MARTKRPKHRLRIGRTTTVDAVPTRSGRPLRLLVVEDNAAIAEMVALWFEPNGWTVTVASSGPEGVARTASFHPDVVLLDLMLPGYDGIEVLRRLRLLNARIPVVLTSACDTPEARTAGIRAGADAFLLKPWSLAQLEQTLMSVTVRAV